MDKLNDVQAARIIANEIMTRAGLFSGMKTDRHDIYAACGYPKSISFSDYRERYERDGIAKRVVEILPRKCWRVDPVVYETEDPRETEFEIKWNDLVRSLQLRLLFNFERLDVLSGIGRYGILFLGFDDGDDFSTPVKHREGARLLYVRPFDESSAEILSYEQDTGNERYGKPDTYRIRMDPTATSGTTSSYIVHWTRTIHVADNLDMDDVFGEPRLKPVWNYILDLEKVAGGSAEMFWQGGFPGISFEMPPDADLDTETIGDMKDQIHSYIHGMARYLTLRGVTAKSMTPQVADPRNHVEVLMSLIGATIGIPYRMFLGSEEARLASIQDKENMNDTIVARQNQYLTPTFIRPFVDRCQNAGVLPEAIGGSVEVEWPDLYKPNPKDRAEVSLTKARALGEYAGRPQSQDIIPPKIFLMSFLDMEASEVDAIEEELESHIRDEEQDAEKLRKSLEDEEQVPEEK